METLNLILDLSRIEAGKLELNNNTTNILTKKINWLHTLCGFTAYILLWTCTFFCILLILAP